MAKRIRRTKKEISEDISKTATLLIEEKGFANLTVVGLSQNARIEPIVFYNRYESLSDFIDEFVKGNDYWFSKIVSGVKEVKDPKEQYKNIIRNLFFSLEENKIMQELLRWELSEKNETTRRTAKLREFHTTPLTENYTRLFASSSIPIDSISALIIGGIYYLILHKDLSPFSGIDINTQEGKDKIGLAIDYLVETLFSEDRVTSEKIGIARKMKAKGIGDKIISECTGISLEKITQL